MNLADHSFHDAVIQEVRHLPEQILHVYLHYPTDWENNIFENRILQFTEVVSYTIQEIPFQDKVTILEITGEAPVTRLPDQPAFTFTRKSAVLHTNAGMRTIEYQDCMWIEG